MGIQLWGAFGGFRKKTGALVGRRLDGQNVISAIPHPSKKPATTAQSNQRAKFKLLVSYLSRLASLINIGFQNAHEKTEKAFNAAFKLNFKNAVTGIAPNFTIDCEKLMYSKGKLSVAQLARVSAEEVGKIKFDWLTGLSTGIGKPTDLATLVVYCAAKDQFVTLVDAAPRSALTYVLPLPFEFSGELVHCWISMVSADHKLASNSTYIVEIEVL